ncbi:MAG: winged helix DNA-binding protein [Proteobacteria bacterium]|nr:winged helix DNA-binding protein [Pseudomonadota bacterium]
MAKRVSAAAKREAESAAAAAGRAPAWKVPAHLGAAGYEREVTAFEQTLICAAEAFYRFAGAVLGPAARAHNLTGHDNITLQLLVTAGAPRGIADLSRFANRDDIANIQYSLRKLSRAGLIEKVPGSTNRETTYRVTAAGRTLTDAFIKLRRELFVDPTRSVRDMEAHLRAASRALGLVTGFYDHASRVIAGRG